MAGRLRSNQEALARRFITFRCMIEELAPPHPADQAVCIEPELYNTAA